MQFTHFFIVPTPCYEPSLLSTGQHQVLQSSRLRTGILYRGGFHQNPRFLSNSHSGTHSGPGIARESQSRNAFPARRLSPFTLPTSVAKRLRLFNQNRSSLPYHVYRSLPFHFL
ncbi:hypothetical protein PCASD_12987 [Puccinia coronata f. sp. avenae]|uniref:Uncharacterized protein n=1 Tax=Puccinia coronata f. sp. avenae TaxID=200324 RepID=A0A2N5UBI5_9BASI|nr:hypothetical protein PCASD_12987 [Puccinia coronata f. sp. avenae]